MREIILALITDTSGTFVVMFVAAFGILPVSVIVAAMRRRTRFAHTEAMNALRYAHEEKVLQLNRDTPQVVGSERALEHRREDDRGDR